jgi:hypothetical protein
MPQRCPFYGFHWPEDSCELIASKDSECGLDVNSHAPCGMEVQGMPPDFGACPLVRRTKPFLDNFIDHIRFRGPAEGSQPLSFEEWLPLSMKRRQ